MNPDKKFVLSILPEAVAARREDIPSRQWVVISTPLTGEVVGHGETEEEAWAYAAANLRP